MARVMLALAYVGSSVCPMGQVWSRAPVTSHRMCRGLPWPGSLGELSAASLMSVPWWLADNIEVHILYLLSEMQYVEMQIKARGHEELDQCLKSIDQGRLKPISLMLKISLLLRSIFCLIDHIKGLQHGRFFSSTSRLWAGLIAAWFDCPTVSAK